MHLGMLWVEASNQICQWLLNGMCQEIYFCHQDRKRMMLWTEVHLSFPKEVTGNHPGLKWCLLYKRISIQFEEPDRHTGSWGFHLRSFFLQSNKGWTACWMVGFDGFSVSIQRIQSKLAIELVQLIMLRPRVSLQRSLSKQHTEFCELEFLVMFSFLPSVQLWATLEKR